MATTFDLELLSLHNQVRAQPDFLVPELMILLDGFDENINNMLHWPYSKGKTI